MARRCPQHRMQIEEPRSYKPATGEPVQDEGSRALPIVTERGLHLCMNFRVALIHKALCQRQRCAIKDTESSWIPSQDKVACFTKQKDDWIGLREENGVNVFHGWICPATTAGRNRSKIFRLTPNEHNVDVAPVDPQVRKLKTMNPDDTV